MHKRYTILRTLFFIALLPTIIVGSAQDSGISQTGDTSANPESLLLKDYRPESIHNVQVSVIEKAQFPVIDMHSHDYVSSREEIAQWVETMKQSGIERAVILSEQTGSGFDEVVERYSGFETYFELWCGIDYTGYDEEGWAAKAIKELERCRALGALGIGELGDKGKGLFYSKPTPAFGMHLDDERMVPVLERAGELGMPVNIHVTEPMWMYEPMDSTNDGLMNGYNWRVDLSDPATLDHAELISTLENALKKNPGTTFIACHFANCSHDLEILGRLLDGYPNLYADISARYGETSPIPRYMQAFYDRYQDRLVYGTDMGTQKEMYQLTFRILESSDEHFYAFDQLDYHWPLHGFGLESSILKKLYRDNALKITRKQ